MKWNPVLNIKYDSQLLYEMCSQVFFDVAVPVFYRMIWNVVNNGTAKNQLRGIRQWCCHLLQQLIVPTDVTRQLLRLLQAGDDLRLCCTSSHQKLLLLLPTRRSESECNVGLCHVGLRRRHRLWGESRHRWRSCCCGWAATPTPVDHCYFSKENRRNSLDTCSSSSGWWFDVMKHSVELDIN